MAFVDLKIFVCYDKNTFLTYLKIHCILSKFTLAHGDTQRYAISKEKNKVGPLKYTCPNNEQQAKKDHPWTNKTKPKQKTKQKTTLLLACFSCVAFASTNKTKTNNNKFRRKMGEREYKMQHLNTVVRV